MEIKKVKTIKDFSTFYKTVYQNDRGYKDNKTNLLPLVCGAKSAFFQNSVQQMLAVKEGKSTLCQAVLILHKNQKDTLVLAFFEALQNTGAVSLLLDYAEKFGREHGCKRMIAGMDGHLNYSLGFSIAMGNLPSFGEGYNPPYYREFFGGFREVLLSSYIDDIAAVKERVNKDYEKFSSLISDYIVEPASLSRKNLRRYTELSNEIFIEHEGYYWREYEEDYELFSSMKLLLDSENLLFIKNNGKDIGYIVWYPDFNELVPAGGRFGVSDYLRYKFLKKPEKMKVVEICVLPSYQNKGVVMLAFKQAIDVAEKKFPAAKRIFSSWILESNTKSIQFTTRYTKQKYKEFAFYEKEI